MPSGKSYHPDPLAPATGTPARSFVERLREHADGLRNTGQSVEMFVGWGSDAARLLRAAGDEIERLLDAKGSTNA